MPNAVRAKQRRNREPVGNPQRRTPQQRNVAAYYQQGGIDDHEEPAVDPGRVSPVSPIPPEKSSWNQELLGHMKACRNQRRPRQPVHHLALRELTHEGSLKRSRERKGTNFAEYDSALASANHRIPGVATRIRLAAD